MPSFVVIVIALVLLGMSARIVREIYIARRAGMSERTPVCANCFYRLGGWTSSVCPECGTDLLKEGVRTGPRVSKSLAELVFILVTLVVVAPLTYIVTFQVFLKIVKHENAEIRSNADSSFEITYSAQSVSQRFPPVRATTIDLYLMYYTKPNNSHSWFNGRMLQPPNSRMAVISFDYKSSEPSQQEIQSQLASVLPANTSDDVLNKYATAVSGIARLKPTNNLSVALNDSVLSGLSAGLFRSGGSWGRGSTTDMNLLGYILVAVVILTFLIIGIRTIRRWCHGGWRMPTPNEWRAGDSEFT